MAEPLSHNNVAMEASRSPHGDSTDEATNSITDDAGINTPSDQGPENPSDQDTVTNKDVSDDSNKNISTDESISTGPDLQNSDNSVTVTKELNHGTSSSPANHLLDATITELEKHNETLRKKMNEMSHNLTAIIEKTSSGDSPEKVKSSSGDTPEKVNSQQKNDDKASSLSDIIDSNHNTSDKCESSRELSSSSQTESLSEETFTNGSESEEKSFYEDSLEKSNNSKNENIHPPLNSRNIVLEGNSSEAENSIEPTEVKDITGLENNEDHEDSNDFKSVDQSSENDDTSKSVPESSTQTSAVASVDEIDGVAVSENIKTVNSENEIVSETPETVKETIEASVNPENKKENVNLNTSDDLLFNLSETGKQDEAVDVPLVIDTTKYNEQSDTLLAGELPKTSVVNKNLELSEPANENISHEITTANEQPEPANHNEQSEPASPVESSDRAVPMETFELANPMETSESASAFEKNEPATPMKISETATPMESSETATPMETTKTASPMETSELASPFEKTELASPMKISETSTPMEPSETATQMETTKTASPMETTKTASPMETSETTTPMETSETATQMETSEPAAPYKLALPNVLSESQFPNEPSKSSKDSLKSAIVNKPSELTKASESTSVHEPFESPNCVTQSNPPVANEQYVSTTVNESSESTSEQCGPISSDAANNIASTQFDSDNKKDNNQKECNNDIEAWSRKDREQETCKITSEQIDLQTNLPKKTSWITSEAVSICTTTPTVAKTANPPVAVTSTVAAPGINSSFDWSQLGVHRCVNCKFTTDEEEMFRNHVTTCMRLKQGDVKLSCGLGVPMSYSCDTCNISWVNKTEFEEHVVCHIVDSPYLCITCKRNFQSRHAIERHAKVDHPQGDSKCALRGMKKCRQYVRDVEVSGKVSFTGRLTIPRTPRNQIENTESDSTGLVSNTVVTMPMPRPQISKFMHVASAGEEVVPEPKLNDTIALTSLKTTPVTSQGEKNLTMKEQQSLSSLFQVLDKSSATGTFQPAVIPSKIQKMVNVTTSNSVQPPAQGHTSKVPAYQVKNFTEFTQPQAIQHSVKTLSSTPLLLIPVGPVVQGNPIQQIQQPLVHALSPLQQVQQPQVFQPGTNVAQTPINIVNQPQSNQVLFFSSQANYCATVSMPTVSPVNVQAVSSLTTTSTAGIPRVAATRQPPTTGQQVPVLQTSGTPVEQSAALTVPAQPVVPPPPLLTLNKPQPRLLVPNVNNFKVTAAVPPLVSAPNIESKVDVPVPQVKNDEALVDKEKTYTFRIKPHKGFVCESCRKYTRDELVFRRHIWEHFHVHSMTCKYCRNEKSEDLTKKGVLGCKLVGDIVCKLVKRSTKTKGDEPILIDITSDDEDQDCVVVGNGKSKELKEKESQAVEVIVLDDDSDNENEKNLNIKITSTYSLAGADDLEKMNKDIGDNAGSETEQKDSDKQVIAGTDVESSTEKGRTGGSPAAATSEPICTDDQQNNSPTQNNNNPAQISYNPAQNTNLTPNSNPAKNCNLAQNNRSVQNTTQSDPGNKVLTEQELNTQTLLSKAFDEIASQPDVIKSVPAKHGSSSDKQKEKINTEGTQINVLGNELSNMSSLLTKKIKFESNIIASQGHYSFYMCAYETCKFSCLSPQSYRDHLQAHHLNEFNYICCHCGRKDYNEDIHVRHLFSHASNKQFCLYQCAARLCKYKTNMINMYAKHINKHENFVIDCMYCHKKFSTIDSLISHLQENLLQYANCLHCPFKFAQKTVVLEHIKLFHSDKPRMLTVTSQIVCKDRDLHFYVMPKVKRCVQKEPVRRSATETLTIGAILDQLEKGSVEVSPSGSAQPGKTTATVNDSTSQNIIMEPKPANKPGHNITVKHRGKHAVGPKYLQCPHCTYLSHNQTFHVQHVSSHDNEPEREKRFVCNLCPKGMDILNNFKKHVSNHIGKNEIKTFHCTLCVFSTNQKCHIYDHLADNHDKQGMYRQNIEVINSTEAKCQYCDFRARQVVDVVNHEKAVHRVAGGDDVESDLGPPVLEREGAPPKSSGSNKKNKYHCSYCPNLFKHKNDLKEHMEEDHQDIANKQFVFYKCKYCSYTSTMKDFIVSHTRDKHPDKNLTMLRKIETIVSGTDSTPDMVDKEDEPAAQTSQQDIVKEKIAVPDGNTFKHPFKCTKCDFSSNLRIKVMRHIREHPELTPVREGGQSSKKRITARKSTTAPSTPELPTRKAHSALFQDVPQAHMTNPFATLRSGEEAEAEKDNLYALGENNLHIKLSACFIPLENDLKFQCRICTQKIAKKFVLHRHILNHLNIVFFKCKYCDEGSIERSLLYGHIQKVHPQMPLEFTQMTKAELDSEFKEKIFDQNFNDIVNNSSTEDRSVSPAETAGIIKQPVHERLADSTVGGKAKSSSRIKSCPYCRYSTNRSQLMVLHIKYHFDPDRNYICSLCYFRSEKFNVVKHIYNSHRGCKKPKVILDTGSPPREGEDLQAKSGHLDNATEHLQAKSGHLDNPTEHLQEEPAAQNADSEPFGKANDNSNQSNNQDEGQKRTLKSMLKCRICGTLRGSMSGMYKHLSSNNKCNRPWYKCSICSFKSSVKSEMSRHGKHRHMGKKPGMIMQPVKAKMKTVNISVPVTGDMSLEARELSVPIDPELSTVCQICYHKSDRLMTLQYHINTAHGGNMLYCQECSYKTPLVKHIINHCANVHEQSPANYKLHARGPPGASEEDSSSFMSAASLANPDNWKMASKQSHFHTCPKCDYKSEALANIKRHLSIHFSYRPYQCFYCDVGTLAPSVVKRHCSKVHPNKPFKFRYVKDTVIEMKIEKLYQQIRRKKLKHDRSTGASRPSRINNYDLVEDGIRSDGTNFYCDICGYKNHRKDVIKTHIRKIHTPMSSPSKKRSLSPDDADFSSPPRKVPKPESAGKKDFEIHTSDSEGSEDENEGPKPQMRYTVVLDADGTKLFKCPICDYKGKKKKNLQMHMKTHGAKLFQCLYCDFTSKLITNAYRHVENLHPGRELKLLNKKSKTVVFPRKGHGLYSPSSSSTSPGRSLSDLMEEGSAMEKKKKKKGKKSLYYCCNLCPLKVKGKYHFQQHLALHPEYIAIIPGDRATKLPCSYCSYVSTSLNDYSVHHSSHLGEVRFKCLYCAHTSFVRSQLISHMTKMHPSRPKLVVDRECKDITSLSLVDLSPNVVLRRVQVAEEKSKFKRIKGLADDSSDESNDSE